LLIKLPSTYFLNRLEAVNLLVYIQTAAGQGAHCLLLPMSPVQQCSGHLEVGAEGRESLFACSKGFEYFE
jgi:hypothetical protein